MIPVSGVPTNSTLFEPNEQPKKIDDPCQSLDLNATSKDFSACIEALGLNQIQRHLFLCADQTVAKCCTQAAGLETWDYLKRRLKELELDRPTAASPTCIYRTKANCLRVCQRGPILLVYPDGVWYYSVTPEIMERILQEHIIGHQVVTDYVLCHQPLRSNEQNNLASFATDLDESR